MGLMQKIVFRCIGGELALPAPDLVLVDRRDGGNLIVNPPREVWERSELTAADLTAWSFLVAAAGRAMLDTLPQLEGGCINYWEAGNWALNHEAPPRGSKNGPEHRRVHLHLLGRSRSAEDPSWQWGEAPRFPSYRVRFEWASSYARLIPDEVHAVVGRVEELLRTRYHMTEIDSVARCASCDYPFPSRPPATRCDECTEREP
jgi:hypothetical protein